MSTNARKHAYVRQASSLAYQSNEATKSKSATDYVKFARAALEFQMMTIQAELKLLDELSGMSDDEKMDTLFDLIDKDGSGTIDARELADGLRKIRGDVSFEESLELAIVRVATFDKDEDAKLDKVEFKKLVDTLLEGIGCSFAELSEMLVMQVIFSESGNNALEDLAGTVVSEEINEAVREEEELQKALMDERMKALFKLFDEDGDGTVDFKEVVMGMYHQFQDIDGTSKAAVEALLSFDLDHAKTLNFEQFTRVIINVVAASPDHVKFNDVADSMTRAAASPVGVTMEELTHLFSLDKTTEALMDIHESKEDMYISPYEQGKIHRLFDLWDLDKDNSIDFHELALGLRKFQEATKIEDTVEEAIKVLNACDSNSDQKLDRTEFSKFVAQFANMSGSRIDELIDFMIVTTALKESSATEEAYINSITAGDIYYWGY